tara:strand:- start:176 stop:1333 length:1158 start_codon:yes stop_codon:yes gene_type:complete
MAFATIDLTKGITGVLPSANATYSTPRKNAQPIIINGDCVVSQRGTAIVDESTSGVYRVDRMNVGLSSIGEFRMQQESISSGDAYANGFTKAFRIDCAVADASPAASDIANMTYKMEGNTVQAFKKGTANAEKSTLAFYVKCSKTGTAQVNLIDSDNSRMVSGTYTISSANTWEKKIINFPADTTGALDNDNNKSLELEFALDGGSDFTSGSVQTSWGASNNANRSVNDFALQDNTANDWSITGIQLEVGEFTSTTIPPFQFESFEENLERCQRYFQVIAKKESGDNEDAVLPFAQYSGSTIYGVYNFRTEMRTAPSLSCASGSNYFRWFRQNSNTEFNTFVLDKSSPQNCDLYQSVSGTQGSAGWVRMINNAPDGSLVALNGEL